MKTPRMSGGMLVFFGAALWSLNSPLVKYLHMNSFLLCGLRAMVAALALCAFIRPKQLKWNGWMLVYVCSYSALSLCIILALSLTSAPIAIGMQYTAAIWLFLASCIRNRRFDGYSGLPVLVIITGVICFMCSGTDSSSTFGNLIALTEGVFFALMTVSSKQVSGTNPIGLTAVANLFTGVVVFLLSPSALASLPQITGQEWAIILVLGVVQIGFGYCLYNIGVLRTTAQRASIIALWEMILGPIWVALFLHEYPSMLESIGFIIILLGMLLDNSIQKRGDPPLSPRKHPRPTAASQSLGPNSL